MFENPLNLVSEGGGSVDDTKREETRGVTFSSPLESTRTFPCLHHL